MKCKHAVTQDALFCAYCGTKQDRQLCICSQVNAQDANFCIRCGMNLHRDNNENEQVLRDKAAYFIYDLEELTELAKQKSSPIKDKKISQQDVNALFIRKNKDDNQ